MASSSSQYDANDPSGNNNNRNHNSSHDFSDFSDVIPLQQPRQIRENSASSTPPPTAAAAALTSDPTGTTTTTTSKKRKMAPSALIRQHHQNGKRRHSQKYQQSQDPDKKKSQLQHNDSIVSLGSEDFPFLPMWKHAIHNTSFRNYASQHASQLQHEIEEKQRQQSQQQEQSKPKVSIGLTLKTTLWMARAKISAKKQRYQQVREKLSLAIEKQNLITNLPDTTTQQLEHLDKRKQVNLELYTDENMFKREDNKRSKKLNHFISLWWMDMKKRASNSTISKTTYLQMLKAIYEILCPVMSSSEHDAEAEKDWISDSKGEANISWELFQDAVFELCDIWTDTAEENEYIGFVRDMHEKITEYARVHDLNFIAQHKNDEEYVPEVHEKPWSPEEDEELENLIHQHFEKRNSVLWAHLARDMRKQGLDRTYSECEYRFKELNSKWKQDEEVSLMNFMDEASSGVSIGETRSSNHTPRKPDDAVFKQLSSKLPYGPAQLKRKYFEMATNWDKEEEDKLLQLVDKKKHEQWKQRRAQQQEESNSQHSDSSSLDWNQISAEIPKKDAYSCHAKYSSSHSKDEGKRSRPWTDEEDWKLVSLCTSHKAQAIATPDWDQIAHQFDQRYPQECQERFESQCMEWNPQQEQQLMQVTLAHRNHKIQEDPNAPNAHALTHDDWNSIQSKYFPSKSSAACEFRYYHHSGEWQYEEDVELFKQVTVHGFAPHSWGKVALHMEQRSADECHNRFLKLMSQWTAQEDAQLKEFYSQHGTYSFGTISNMIPGRYSEECHARFLFLKHEWSSDEDAILKDLEQKFEGDWTRISEHFDRRSPRDCAERFKLLRDWQPYEDEQLQQCVQMYGKDWKMAAQSLPFKQPKDCKKRFNQLLKEARETKLRLTQIDSTTSDLVPSSDVIESTTSEDSMSSAQRPSPPSHAIDELQGQLQDLMSGKRKSRAGAERTTRTNNSGIPTSKLFVKFGQWKQSKEGKSMRKKEASVQDARLFHMEHPDYSSLTGDHRDKRRRKHNVSQNQSLGAAAGYSSRNSAAAAAKQAFYQQQNMEPLQLSPIRSHKSSASAIASSTMNKPSSHHSTKENRRIFEGDPSWHKSVYVLDDNYTPPSYPSRSTPQSYMSSLRDHYSVHHQQITFHNDFSLEEELRRRREQNRILFHNQELRPLTDSDRWARNKHYLSKSADFTQVSLKDRRRLHRLRQTQQSAPLKRTKRDASLKRRRNKSQQARRNKESLDDMSGTLLLEKRFEEGRKRISQKLMTLRLKRMEMKKEKKLAKEREARAAEESRRSNSFFPSIS